MCAVNLHAHPAHCRRMTDKPTLFQAFGSQLDVPSEGDEAAIAPKTIQIMPVGKVDAVWDSGALTFELNDPQAVIARTLAGAKGEMLLLDFNHASQSPQSDSRAAGWVTGLRVEDGFIVGDVEWTAAGRASIGDLEYRFLSPTFTTIGKSKKIDRILSVALVNYPAIHALAKVASAKEEPAMDKTIEDIRAALGLGDDATGEQILDGVNSAITAAAIGTAAIDALKLNDDADAAAVTEAVTKFAASGAGAPDPAKFVPIAGYNDMRERLEALETVNTASAAEAAVSGAISAGKVTPAMKDWALDYATKDLDGFNKYVASAAPLGKGKADLAGDPPDADASQLTDADRAVISASGVSEEAYLATKAANAAKKGA